MIGLRRDGQVDHRTLVRNIITVLRRPELPPLDFDDGVLGLFLANSGADKMDMDSMVGDILGMLRLDGCIAIPVTVLSGSRHVSHATWDYKLPETGTPTDSDGLTIRSKTDRMDNLFWNFTYDSESREFTSSVANELSYNISYFQSNPSAAPNSNSSQTLRRLFDKYLGTPSHFSFPLCPVLISYRDCRRP
jgi:hypothetical protein